MRAGVRRPHLVFGLLAVCLWLSGIRPASAAPITYNEAVGGELAGQNIGTFDIGANMVTGSEVFTGFTSFDSFLFTVASGQQLDSIVLTSFSGALQSFTLAPPGTIDTLTRYGFLILSGANVGTDFLPALLLSDPGKTATAPLGAGTYQVVLGSLATTSYHYTFNVSAAPETPTVPEPATLTLTGLGLLGAVFLRRRATHRAPEVD
jgi:hypothetical protein